ncbi:MAG: hypothetical protein ACP5VS_17755 [Desulfomonilaceae bacterium]
MKNNLMSDDIKAIECSKCGNSTLTLRIDEKICLNHDKRFGFTDVEFPKKERVIVKLFCDKCDQKQALTDEMVNSILLKRDYPKTTRSYFNTKKYYFFTFSCQNCKAAIPEENLVEEIRYYHKKGVPGLTEYVRSTSWNCKECGQESSLGWGIPIDVDVSFRQGNGENESKVDYPILELGDDINKAILKLSRRGLSSEK